MKKPIIAISKVRTDFYQNKYLQMLEKYNVEVKILSRPTNNFDALILPGGGDISDKILGETHRMAQKANEERDYLDFTMMHYADVYKRPVLGICKGAQVINVFYGGTIIQDVYSDYDNCMYHSDCLHKVYITEESRYLRQAAGDSNSLFTNSYHHQAVKKVAEGFITEAKACDGIIEAISKKGDRFCLGVQWHPEILADTVSINIFKEMIQSM